MKKADLRPFCERALALGCDRAASIPASNVTVAAWVRYKCRFGCPGFGWRLMCPPYSPTPEETARVVRSYRRAILVHSAKPATVNRTVVAIERELFLAGYYKSAALGSGPCHLCTECALAEGCRHPYKARPAMEACGIDVFSTARKSGFPIEVVKSRSDSADYYGLVLVD